MFINYILGALWVASYLFLILLSSIKLRLPSSIYKLRLNNQKGNKDAAKWLWYWDNRSIVHSLIKIKKGFLLVTFVTLTLVIFGNALGFVIAIIMILLVVRFDNFKIVKQLGDKLFWSFQPKMVAPVKFMSRYFYKLKLSKKDDDPHTPPVSSVSELLGILKFNSSNLPKIEYDQLINLLTIQDVKIHDIMLPKNRIAFVNQDDILTPKLVDDLHKTHNGFALVFKDDIKNLVGVLSLGGPNLLEQIKTPVRIFERMQDGLCYLPEHATISTFVASSIETRQNVFAVVDGKSNITGVITASILFEWQYRLQLPSHELDSITWDNPEAMARYELLQKK